MVRTKQRKTACKVCNHPDRRKIEELLANGFRAGPTIARKFELSTDSIYGHRANHMTKEQIAKLRLGIADELDISIEEITRTEGEKIIIHLRSVLRRCEAAEDRYEKLGDHGQANRARELILKATDRVGKMSGHFPGRSQTVNNTLVLGDPALIEALYREFSDMPDVRRRIAQVCLRASQAPAGNLIEHVG